MALTPLLARMALSRPLNPPRLNLRHKTNQPHPSRPKKPNIDRATQRAIDDTLARHGDDSNAAMATLTRQIHRLEESITTSETDVTELAQYRALGKLGDIQRIVSEHGTWGTERTNNAKGAALQKAATAPKTALNAPLLASLAGALDVDYLTEGEGENAEGFVKLKDGGRKKLTEYVVQTWPNLAEQLKASPVVPVKQVKRMGRGAPAGGGDKPSKAEEIREEVQNRRNGGAVKSSGDSAGGNANTSQSRAGTLLRRNR